jgi:hypothetical protein
MRVAIFSIKNYERTLLDELNTGYRQKIVYFDTLLGPRTASLAAGFPAVSVFVNDRWNASQQAAYRRWQDVSARRRRRQASITSTWERQRNLASKLCGSPIILQTPWPSLPLAWRFSRARRSERFWIRLSQASRISLRAARSRTKSGCDRRKRWIGLSRHSNTMETTMLNSHYERLIVKVRDLVCEASRRRR